MLAKVVVPRPRPCLFSHPNFACKQQCIYPPGRRDRVTRARCPDSLVTRILGGMTPTSQPPPSGLSHAEHVVCIWLHALSCSLFFLLRHQHPGECKTETGPEALGPNPCCSFSQTEHSHSRPLSFLFWMITRLDDGGRLLQRTDDGLPLLLSIACGR